MRLNQKGMTSIELLITFVILSLVVTGMFDVVLNYKDREIIESIRTSIVEYDNSTAGYSCSSVLIVSNKKS